MGSGCGGWLAQVLADQGHLLPGEGAVPALVAGSGEGFDQGCNLQIFLCLFLEKLNMPQNTPVTKAS